MKTLVTLSLLFVAFAAQADNVDLSLMGNYKCIDIGNSGVEGVSITLDGRIKVISSDGIQNGILIDKTSLLSPFKKDLGINQFAILNSQDHQPISNVEMLKTKGGKLLISESDTGLRSYREPEDQSKSTDTKAEINPDVICSLR